MMPLLQCVLLVEFASENTIVGLPICVHVCIGPGLHAVLFVRAFIHLSVVTFSLLFVVNGLPLVPDLSKRIH